MAAKYTWPVGLLCYWPESAEKSNGTANRVESGASLLLSYLVVILWFPAAFASLDIDYPLLIKSLSWMAVCKPQQLN